MTTIIYDSFFVTFDDSACLDQFTAFILHRLLPAIFSTAAVVYLSLSSTFHSAPLPSPPFPSPHRPACRVSCSIRLHSGGVDHCK